jgi:hypothetical protein
MLVNMTGGLQGVRKWALFRRKKSGSGGVEGSQCHPQKVKETVSASGRKRMTQAFLLGPSGGIGRQGK